VAVTPDGRRAVSASDDRTLKVWELETGRELHTLEGHAFPVKAVAVAPDGRRAVSASVDRTLKVWELETGRELHTLGTCANAAPYPRSRSAGRDLGNGDAAEDMPPCAHELSRTVGVAGLPL
jgi:WD40 repeat protein